MNSPEPTAALSAGETDMWNALYFLYACVSLVKVCAPQMPLVMSRREITSVQDAATAQQQSISCLGPLGLTTTTSLTVQQTPLQALALCFSDEMCHCNTENTSTYSQWTEWSTYAYTKDTYKSIKPFHTQALQRTASGLHITSPLPPPPTLTVRWWIWFHLSGQPTHTLCIIEAAWFPLIKE